MPDEDELEVAGDDLLDPNASPEDVLLVDALMGWDGDSCRCVECACDRFIDEAGQDRCTECSAGRHPGVRP